MGEIKAKTLLKFQFNPDFFQELGENLFNKEVVSKNICKLTEISNAIGDVLFKASLTDSKKTLGLLLKSFTDTILPEKVLIDKKKLRGVSYSIPIGNYHFSKYILEILNSNWSSFYIGGLLHCLLSNWQQFKPDERKLFSDFIIGKITNGQSRTSSRLQDSIQYISENGAYRLGHSLKAILKPVYDCCKTFMLPDNRFSYSYFSDTIAGYYGDIIDVDYDDLRKVLKMHNNIVAAKKVIPLVIINTEKSIKISNHLVQLAIEMIGDPFIESRWLPFKGATNEESQNLILSRNILIRKISQEFVIAFFKNLFDDSSARLFFWLKYTRHIANFRIYGSSYSKLIMTGKVNTDILNSHFFVTNRNQDTCALVMVMGEYAIVEFTDAGALYVYKNTNRMYKAIIEDNYSIDKMEDLKNPYMNYLWDNSNGYLNLHNEGRMSHQAGWEHKLSVWLSKMIKT